MKIEIHLQFHGNCRDAFHFYADMFGVDTDFFLTYGDSPEAEKIPVEHHDKIIHASIELENLTLAGTDVFENYSLPEGFVILLQLDSREKAEQYFSAMSEEGEVIMALHEVFWSPCYGIVRDKFGIPWEINCSGDTPDIA